MAEVPSLTALYNAKLRELGERGVPLSHRAAARRVGDEQKYETFRLIGKGEHSGRITEEIVAALVRLGLDERAVRRAAGHQIERSRGPLVLGPETAKLTDKQREAVLSVVRAMLDPGQEVSRDRGLRAVASEGTPPRDARKRAAAERRRQTGKQE